MIDIDYLNAIEELNSEFSAGNCVIKLSPAERFEYLEKKYPQYHFSLDYIPEISPDVLTLRVYEPNGRSIGIRMMTSEFNKDEYILLLLQEVEKKIKGETHGSKHHSQIQC